jgi:hypothetical protein
MVWPPASADDLEHGIDRHAVRRIEHELIALSLIATHGDETPQRARLQRRDQPGRASLQFFSAFAGRRLELARNLQEVSDDDLVVGFCARMLVDRLRDGARLGRRNLFAVRGQRRPGETYPQLRFLGALRRALARSAFDEGKAVEGQRMQLHVRPTGNRTLQANRALAFRFRRQRQERLAQLVKLDSSIDADGADVVTMKAVSETTQHRLPRVGRHAVDDQLAPGDAKRDGRAILQQLLGAAGHRFDRRHERRVTARIHRVPVEGDRQFDEKFAQIARERDALGSRRLHQITRRLGQHGRLRKPECNGGQEFRVQPLPGGRPLFVYSR